MLHDETEQRVTDIGIVRHACLGRGEVGKRSQHRIVIQLGIEILPRTEIAQEIFQSQQIHRLSGQAGGMRRQLQQGNLSGVIAQRRIRWQ